jgi:hypothetical protein
MRFLLDFLTNLGLLFVIGLALLFLFPDMMKTIFQMYGALFGPVLILIIIVMALPRKRRNR